MSIFFHPRRTAIGTARDQEWNVPREISNRHSRLPFFPGRPSILWLVVRAAWKMADNACSLSSLSTLLTRTLRRCLALQICAILSHSRYTAAFFTFFYEAPVASFNNLSMLSAHYLSVSYGMPSQPIHCTSMDFLHLLADKIWTFEFQAGTLAFLGTSGIVCYCALGSVLISAITLSVVQSTIRATFHVYSGFFSTSARYG